MSNNNLLEVATRIFNIMDTLNHYDIQSENVTPAGIAKVIKSDPVAVINTLTGIIEDLL